MKRAFLVSFSPMTRVVIDVENEEDLSEDEQFEAMKVAREQIRDGFYDYFSMDNIEEVKPDIDCPFPDETIDL